MQIAKWAFRITGVVLILALTAMVLGLSYNPWADEKVVTADLQRLQFEALNPISLGHVGGLALICSAFLLADNSPPIVEQVILWAAMPLAGAVMVLANSRGPIIAAATALSFFFLARTKSSRLIVRLAPLLLVFAIVGPPLIEQNEELFQNIWTRFTEKPEENLSNLARVNVQTRAIKSFLEHPLLGAHHRDPELEENEYPHNLIIESAMALGVGGLILFIVLHLRALARISRHSAPSTR